MGAELLPIEPIWTPKFVASAPAGKLIQFAGNVGGSTAAEAAGLLASRAISPAAVNVIALAVQLSIPFFEWFHATYRQVQLNIAIQTMGSIMFSQNPSIETQAATAKRMRRRGNNCWDMSVDADHGIWLAKEIRKSLLDWEKTERRRMAGATGAFTNTFEKMWWKEFDALKKDIVRIVQNKANWYPATTSPGMARATMSQRPATAGD